MRQMWREVVEPALLASRAGRSRVIRRRKIHCFGVGESDLEQMLPDLVRRGRRPTVGITVSSATITLRITAEGESAEACEAMIGPAVEIIRQRLGNLVFGEGDDRLQDVVIRSLIRRQKSLATVEWGIGALATNWLSDADDGGAYLGGWVFRDAAAAARLAGLHESLCGEGSEGPGGVVKAAAEACRRRFDAAYGLAVGPFPASGSDPSSVAMLHYALASPNGADAQSCPFTGHPDLLKARSAKQALNFVRLAILDSPPVR
jgi:nicotinamide-nucleotide amidase